jgi:hypothetical protein
VFSGTLHSPGGRPRHYDILFCVGIPSYSLEEPQHWFLEEDRKKGRNVTGLCDATTLPHNAAYLERCAFFIYTPASVRTNFFRVNLENLVATRHRLSHAWGHERERCRSLWNTVVAEAIARKLTPPSTTPTRNA